MAEPFKNAFNQNLIHGMATHFNKQCSEFDTKAFEADASNNLTALELKARSEQITDAMIKHLPQDFERAAAIMLSSLSPVRDGDIFGATVDSDGIAGWAIMPMAHYVGLRGLDHFECSMELFKEMTKRFSSEFGIRFFLLASPEKTLIELHRWITDDNRHVRRLVSEGTRTRLPWAMRLPLFIQDPTPVVALLEGLKDDEDEYVRRSVANNLNDLSKDHPELITGVSQRWMLDANRDRQRLVRHACRSLIKKGDKKVLQLLGYGPPRITQVKFELLTPHLAFGTPLQFRLSCTSDASHDQALMIDYVIHHQKANGRTTAKVFKWRTITLAGKQALISSKKHMIKRITTRTYYPGRHTVEVIVNGVCVASSDFQLLM